MEGQMRRRWMPVAIAAAVAVAVITAGFWYALRPEPTRPVSSDWVPASALPGATTAAPTGSPSASPSPSPSATKPSPTPTKNNKSKPKPSLSPAPVNKPTPPPVPPATPPGTPSPGDSCPTLTGPKAPLSDVQSALVSSAGKAYWGDGVTLPADLVKAIAWEESGWQSTIKSCDGGIGTMQIMPATADWMNTRLNPDYDINTLTGNVALGAEYLEWLTGYFGDKYFNGDYTLKYDSDVLVLPDVVIGAYQQGYGVIDNALRDGTKFPNWWYINAVESFMDSKPWVAAMSG